MNDMNLPVRVVELLCSRICHDLVSPVAAIGNGVELLTEMGRVLEARHARGLRTVLIIDEAHELSDYVLEEIRLLLNFESDNAKHLQIVLTGQPELREAIARPSE